MELIEDQEEGGEGISDRVGGTVCIQCGKHFKTVAIVNIALVLKEETKHSVHHGKMELAFPRAAGLEVGGGHDQFAISTAGGKLRLLKVELNDTQSIKVGLHVLDGVKFKNLHGRR